MLEQNLSNQVSENVVTLFAHAPRTGGDAFQRTFYNYYKHSEILFFGETWQAWQRLRRLGPSLQQPLKCVRGHGVYFGLHQYLHRPCSYIGMIRNPVDRVISQYYLYLQDETNGMHRHIVDNNISLDQFQQSTPNHQTDYILGFPHFRANRPTQSETDSVQHNIERAFCLLGVTDRFDESVFLLKKTLGWDRYVYWAMSRKNKKRPPKEEVPDDLVRKIASNNQLDQYLYEAAHKLLANKLQSLSEEEQRELSLFRKGQGIFHKLREEKGLPLEIRFQNAILQPHYTRATIIGDTLNELDIVQQYAEAANSHLPRPFETRVISGSSEEELLSLLQHSQHNEYVQSSHVFLAATTPGRDYVVTNALKRAGLADKPLEFAFIPPAI